MGAEDPLKVRGLEQSFLLATGSSDGFAYVYDLSGTGAQSLQSITNPLQRLGAHRDVVYGVNFHPKRPIMASHSKDWTIKLWAPTPKALPQNEGWGHLKPGHST